MQYYYLKQKVNLGDIIDFNGLKVEVTMNLIKANPELFVVEEEKELLPEYWECIKNDTTSTFLVKIQKGRIYKRCNIERWNKHIVHHYGIYICTVGSKEQIKYFKPSTKEAFERQELLEEAKRRYPVGTRFKSVLSGKIYTIESTSHKWIDKGIEADNLPWVYYDGNWAEILTPLFQTEDKVDIYEGDEYWYSYKSAHCCCHCGNANLNVTFPDDIIRFSTKEATEAWLKANKPKDLQYYEDLVCNSNTFDMLKTISPKLYYLQILSLIQRDLDDGWKPDWKNSCELKYYIYYWNRQHSTYRVESNTVCNTGVIYFKSEKSAQKAIEIMGDKLNYIFL